MVSKAERRALFHIFLAWQFFRVIGPITPVPKVLLGPYIIYGIPLE